MHLQVTLYVKQVDFENVPYTEKQSDLRKIKYMSVET